MQNTITEVINSVLREQGLASEPRATRVVEQVSGRLAQRLSTGVNAVVQAAVRDGYDEATVREVFVSAGLAERPAPVAAPAAARSPKKGERISRLEATVERLVAAARARGLNV